MANENLNEGSWLRQVLKGKKSVRIAFVPDDPSQQVQTAKIAYDEANKTAWEKLLGNPPINIDLGTILVRFNRDGTSGTATFLSSLSRQEEIIHPFQQVLPVLPVAGLPEFVDCISGKRTVLGVNFNYPLAFTQCLPLLVQ